MKTLLKIFMVLLTMHLGFTNLQAEEWNWAKQAGGVWVDSGEAICTDDMGNVYTAGYFSGIAQFGDISIQSSGSYDIYIAKMDYAGNYLWVKKAGGSGSNDDAAEGIAVDSDGNIVVVGSYSGNNAEFGDLQVSGGGYFIAKLDSDGEFLWVTTGEDNGSAHAYAVDVDPNGNIYLTGMLQGTVSFGDFTLIGTISDMGTAIDAAYIAKLDGDGNFLWAKRIDEPEDGWLIARGHSIKVDNEGKSASGRARMQSRP